MKMRTAFVILAGLFAAVLYPKFGEIISHSDQIHRYLTSKLSDNDSFALMISGSGSIVAPRNSEDLALSERTILTTREQKPELDHQRDESGSEKEFAEAQKRRFDELYDAEQRIQRHRQQEIVRRVQEADKLREERERLAADELAMTSRSNR